MTANSLCPIYDNWVSLVWKSLKAIPSELWGSHRWAVVFEGKTPQRRAYKIDGKQQQKVFVSWWAGPYSRFTSIHLTNPIVLPSEDNSK